MKEKYGALLVEWDAKHGRELPWRAETDPYKIWISEIVLQQTRTEQGLPYYKRFIERFPDVASLARAEEDDVMKAWEGLGYYSRARNLRAAAKTVADKHCGRLPETVDELLKLKGVGPYTARAVASFAFGARAAVLDGNVFRVLSRVEGDDTSIDLPKSRKHYQAIADRWLADHPSAAFNQAIMDFGAQVCLPRNPGCAECPLRDYCKAFAEGRVAELPRKSKKRARAVRFFDFYYVKDGDATLVRKRGAVGFWKNLWELPNRERAETDPPEGRLLAARRHAFTHFEMRMRLVAPEDWTPEPGDRWALPHELDELAFPTAIRKLLADLDAPQLALDF